MPREKDKHDITSKFVIRTGGLLIGLPASIILGSFLAFISLMLVVLIVFGTEAAGVPSQINPILVSVLALCLYTLWMILRANLRYSGGIYALWRRIRGIQEEQARINRLVEHSPEDYQGGTREQLSEEAKYRAGQ